MALQQHKRVSYFLFFLRIWCTIRNVAFAQCILVFPTVLDNSPPENGEHKICMGDPFFFTKIVCYKYIISKHHVEPLRQTGYEIVFASFLDKHTTGKGGLGFFLV